MRRPVVLALLACAAAAVGATGCGSDPSARGDPAAGASATVPAGARALSEALLPVASTHAQYVMRNGAARALRVEAAENGVVLWLEGAATGVRRMDVRREAAGYVFSGGPDAETELIRLGARPGDAWESGAAQVRFDGWERIAVPAGDFDAARIRTVTGPESLAVVQTWWFAEGAGLVRLRSDRGGVFAEEMSLVSAPERR